MKLEGQGRRKVGRLCSLQGRESGESFQNALISKGIISNRQAEKTESSLFISYPVLTEISRLNKGA
jgi:hypothetical protein